MHVFEAFFAFACLKLAASGCKTLAKYRTSFWRSPSVRLDLADLLVAVAAALAPPATRTCSIWLPLYRMTAESRNVEHECRVVLPSAARSTSVSRAAYICCLDLNGPRLTSLVPTVGNNRPVWESRFYGVSDALVAAPG